MRITNYSTNILPLILGFYPITIYQIKGSIKLYILCLANYGGSSTLPSVLSSKCDGSTCSVVTRDVDVVKSCLNDPLSAGCKGQQSSHSIIYLILPELKCPGKPCSHKLPG